MGTAFFMHPEKGWCCKCCNGTPLAKGEWMQNHYKVHHVAPDMLKPENWWQAIRNNPGDWDVVSPVLLLEAIAGQGAVCNYLAREYERQNPEVNGSGEAVVQVVLHDAGDAPAPDSEPVPAGSKKVRVRNMARKHRSKKLSRTDVLPSGDGESK